MLHVLEITTLVVCTIFAGMAIINMKAFDKQELWLLTCIHQYKGDALIKKLN